MRLLMQCAEDTGFKIFVKTLGPEKPWKTIRDKTYLYNWPRKNNNRHLSQSNKYWIVSICEIESGYKEVFSNHSQSCCQYAHLKIPIHSILIKIFQIKFQSMNFVALFTQENGGYINFVCFATGLITHPLRSLLISFLKCFFINFSL